MDEKVVSQLKEAGNDASKQLPALVNLGKFYLEKAKTTANGADFTKADGLFNAAFVRSRRLNDDISENEILRGIIEVYREFLLSLANDAEVSVDEISDEIDSHKEFVANERRTFKERLDEIDSCFNTTDRTENDYKIRADKVHDVFRDIQDMYTRLVTKLAKECESRLGPPPCDYAVIALGSVARMEATPFSDLEFAILYSDSSIGDKISYFRILTHFLHLKVINLGETILPALAIEQLNDFQSSMADSSWFYDSVTPRGISFDGAMPWASKTPLGRKATEGKPAVELIRTPEQMAELQDEETAVREGYHLADIMSRAVLLHGNQVLLDEYNERVAEKLNTTSSSTVDIHTRTAGFIRGIRQMAEDSQNFDPYGYYLSYYLVGGGLFDAKKEFYRLISLLLSDLGLIFDIRSPSPWQILLELQTRGTIAGESASIVESCLSIANEIRLRTYIANNKQAELLSPVPQQVDAMEENVPIFRYFDDDILVRLLSVSIDMHDRCQEIIRGFNRTGEIDTSIFKNPFTPSSDAHLIGLLYFRLQNFPEALKWIGSESNANDSSNYLKNINIQGVIYQNNGEFEKSVQCFENLMFAHYTNRKSCKDFLLAVHSLAIALACQGKLEKARTWLGGGIEKYNEVYGKGSKSIILGQLMQTLGTLDILSQDFRSAIITLQKVVQMYERIRYVPDMLMHDLSLNVAVTLSYLDQHELSITYMKQAINLSYKMFGENSLTSQLAVTYMHASRVYLRCGRNDEAMSLGKQSLELCRIIHSDPKQGKIPLRTIHAEILCDLGTASLPSKKSLEYFLEGKEIMDTIQGPIANHNHEITSRIIHGIASYFLVHGDFAKAFDFENGPRMSSVVYEENSANDDMETLCTQQECTHVMDEKVVSQLKEAGNDASKQLPALVKLGKFYLEKAKTTANGADFTKADGIFNAAFVRSRRVNDDISENKILRGIIEVYREFLLSLANDAEVSVDEISDEIDSHKEFVANERRTFKERLDEIDSCFNTTDRTENDYKIRTDKVHDVFRDIQDMYTRLVTMLAKECESRLGPPPCDYAVIALGSVARMEATPFSDLEFAILYSDSSIGDKISYFRILTHFLHLKVINLGETILPALGIEQLNDFQSSMADSSWFYDSVTPRGISFDGAMPWASKTPLGRKATEGKPAVELIRTPEQMAELQDEETALREGYHLADIMSRAVLLHGNQVLLDEYNERVAEKLNTTSSSTVDIHTRTAGFIRGIRQMAKDSQNFDPYGYYLSYYLVGGGVFDAKREFYRLISLLLSDLGLIFDIRSPSPWQILLELQTRGTIAGESASIVESCLSIANEIRLRTYIANNKQAELLSPVPQQVDAMEENVPIFRYFDDDILVRLLSISIDMHDRCQEFILGFNRTGEIDTSIFKDPFTPSSDAHLIGLLYFRLQNFPEALKWIGSESNANDSSNYLKNLNIQGVIYQNNGEFEKSVQCFENLVFAHCTNRKSSKDFLLAVHSLAIALACQGKLEKARTWLEEGIDKYNEVYGEGFKSVILGQLMQTLGTLDILSQDFTSAIKTLQKVAQMYNRLRYVPDMLMHDLSLNLAATLSYLDQHELSITYMKRAINLSYKMFGENSLTSQSAVTYMHAVRVYLRCGRNDEAMSFGKRSLELCRIIHSDPKQGKIPFGTIHAAILCDLGTASLPSKKSLEYFLEGKEIMDTIQGPIANHNHKITSRIIHGIASYFLVHGDFAKAYEYFEDGLRMSSVIYEENSANDDMETSYQTIGFAAQMMGKNREAKKYYIEAVKISRKINFMTKKRFGSFVLVLDRLSSICEADGEQDEALKYLEEARELAKVHNSVYKFWMVVNILHKLILKYLDMEFAVQSVVMCFQEAREAAMNIPEDDSIPPDILKLIKLLTN